MKKKKTKTNDIVYLKIPSNEEIMARVLCSVLQNYNNEKKEQQAGEENKE